MNPFTDHERAGRARAADPMLTPEGTRLDAANAAQFKNAAVRRLQPGERAVVDLRGLRFLDSSGIGALVGIARHLGSDGELRLLAPDPEVRALLSITRIDQILTVVDDPTRATA